MSGNGGTHKIEYWKETTLMLYLKVANIDTIESGKSYIQADVSLGKDGASKVTLVREDFFHSVKSCKHLSHSFVISLLTFSNPAR